MPRKPRIGLCVYCNSHGVVTSDHVPPKSLFPPSSRVNLVTVAACPACHESFTLDDEYFRVTLSIRDDLPEGANASFLREQTRRTFRNPLSRRFSASIRAATVQISMHSPAGIYLGKTTALRLNPPRIIRTAKRIIQGLYAKFFGHPLPKTHEVAVTVLDFQRDNSALEAPEVKELLGLLGQHGTKCTFGSILELWYLKTDEDPESSLWWIDLHGAFGFLGFTLPVEV